MLFSAANMAFAKELPDFTELADQEGAAVVNISVTQAMTAEDQSGAMPYPGIPEDGPLGEFFRRFGIPMPGAPGSGGGDR